MKTRPLSKGTIALFAVAVTLLLVSGIGSASAAMVYFSETYEAQVDLPKIEVGIFENGDEVVLAGYDAGSDTSVGIGGTLIQKGDLAQNLLSEGEQFMLGRSYREALSAANNGNIDIYIRAKISKYWIGPSGEKRTDLSPDLIDLEFFEGNGWIEDAANRTDERTILYYTPLLQAAKDGKPTMTPEMSGRLSVSPEVATSVTETAVSSGGTRTITSTYDYDGVKFVVSVEVDAVQSHNAEKAIKSAWGVDVRINDDGSYTLL